MGAEQGDADAQAMMIGKSSIMLVLSCSTLKPGASDSISVNGTPYRHNGNARGDQPVDDGPYVQGRGNEPTGGAHHLHGFNQEPVAVHGQADGVVDRKTPPGW